MGKRKKQSAADDLAAGTLQDGDSNQGPAQHAEPRNAESRRPQHRERKRGYYNAIRSQMEFYFSDANLYKDRYLKQLIDEDPLVPLETFLTFNKIKQMTSKVQDIAKALSSSQLLELDESSSKVRRKTALPAVRNADYRTIYVEVLPTYADHDWLHSCFERFGPVAYVSVPRYPQSKRIKQFAFVEFARAGCLERVIKTYERLNNVLTAQANPAELYSIQAFLKERNEIKKNAEAAENAAAAAAVAVEECSQPKRRLHRRISNDVERPGVKYLRNESGGRALISIEDSTSEALEDDEQDSEGDDDDNGDEEEDGVAENEEAENQANHQARRKRRHRRLKPRSKIYELEPDQLQLRIASKLEWKRLRNKYLNMQRQAAGDFKRANRLQRARHNTQRHNPETENGAVPRDKKQSIAQQANGDVQQMNMNFYGAGDGETADGKTSSSLAAVAAKPSNDFERGLIVRVGLLEPCIYVNEFKADMRQYAAIKYVDIRKGATQAFLRCESAPAAEEVIRKLNSAEMACTLLVGEPEALYWRKIQEDRSAKLNKNEKVRCRRGREKLKQRIADHVYFYDEEEHEHVDEHDAGETTVSVEET